MALSQNGSLYSAKLGASSHKVASMMHAPITNKHTFGAVTKPSTLLRLNFPPLNHNNVIQPEHKDESFENNKAK